MISIVNKKISDLNKALILSNLNRKKNYRGKIHDKVRDFFIKNLDVISEGLEFVEKELRIVGGDIDIVAKRGQIFYLIEVKTRLSHYPLGSEDQIAQLLRQMKGLNHIISMFINEAVSIKLIIVEYVRDKGKVIVKNISNSGKVEGIRSMGLKVD